MEKTELKNRFTYHAPKDDQPEKYETIRAEAHQYARSLILMCPDSRELTKAITHLEEVVFWANAAIARRSNSWY
jgi:hypothetical protein